MLLIQILRRLTQSSIVFLIVALPFISLYAHYHAARATEDIQYLSGPLKPILLQIDRMVAPLQNPAAFLEGYKGTLWSMRFAGIDISDPLAVAETIMAAGSIHVPFLVTIIIPLIVTLLLGRVFCSWICPANLMFEVANLFRSVLAYAELKPADLKFSLRNKYVVLAAGLGIAAIVGRPLFAIMYPPAVLSRLPHAYIFGTAFSGMLVILLVMIAVELFVAPRWWCRTMCPGGALYALIGWPRLLRVKLNQACCNSCGSCIDVCEAGINPETESAGIECTNCAECIRICPQHALGFSIGLPAGRSRKPAPASLLFWLVPFILLGSLFPGVANGHHILGLPHYSYKENYPQTPTLEYPAMAGPYDILLTSYPGKPVPGETASLSFYIKNKTTGAPFENSIQIRVLRTFTFGKSSEVLAPTVLQPYERPYRLTVTFPADGEYVVELTMEVEGKPEVIPFIMIAGEPTATPSVLVALGAALVVFIIIIRAIKIKRARKAVTEQV